MQPVHSHVHHITNMMTLPGCMGKVKEYSGVCLHGLRQEISCCLLEKTLCMLMLMSSLPFRFSFTSSLLRNGKFPLIVKLNVLHSSHV
jgi:hypothetical protein